MVEITNIEVYDLKESVIASRNAMRLTPPEYTDEEYEASLPRAIKLAQAKDGSGHKNWLCGVRVAFDIKYPNYFSPELQRYHFNDIVASSSKMHRLLAMDIDKACNKYVSREAINLLKRCIDMYNDVLNKWTPTCVYRNVYRGETNKEVLFETTSQEEALYDAFMRVVSNCPLGIELFMRCTTNYLQLRTIYMQRKNHKLKEDWGAFVDAIRSLPLANQLILTE